MKKPLLFLTAAVLLFVVLSSCSKDDTPASPEPISTPNATQTAVAQKTVVAGFSYTSFTSVPIGTFTQEDPYGTSFSHTISSFYMGKYEVTYELWYEVRQWALSKGYAFANAGREGNDGTDGAEPTGAKYEPVTYINWRDVIVWCNAYSQMAGLTPVYCSDAGFTTPIKDSTDGAYGSSINTAQGSYDNPYVNWDCDGYRLPTEGEWEYAARYINGSSWTPYNYASGDTAPYNTSTTIGDYCWYGENSGNVTHDVGGKTANALGIYDMSGNMYEWCWDWDADYPGASTNYRGPASGSLRMLRGGGYRYIAEYLQTGYRNFTGSPFVEADVLGFRLARTQ